MLRRCLLFLTTDEAATSVEYAVMLGLILAVIFTSIVLLGNQTSGLWTSNQTNLQDAGFGS